MENLLQAIWLEGAYQAFLILRHRRDRNAAFVARPAFLGRY